MPARGRDPGAGPQAAGDDATARHDATRDAAARHDATCDAAARHDGPADADDDATLKSQTFVAATALINNHGLPSTEFISILTIIMCNIVIIYIHPSFIMVLPSS